MRGLIRLLGRMVMVTVAAILIGSGLAAPAAAKTRDDGVQEANDFILACVRLGGDPEVTEVNDDVLIAECRFSEGTLMECIWGVATDWARDCAIFHGRLVSGGLPTFEPDDLHTLEPVRGEPAPVTPAAVTAPGDNQDDEQVSESKKKQKKQAKKAKKGKGNGKAKQDGKRRGGR